MVCPTDTSVLIALCPSATDGVESSGFLLGVMKSDDFICERCKRYTAEKYGTPCSRCLEVLSTGWE